jgi:hypothetical protein
MSCHLSMNLMELVVALTTQLDFCHNCQKKMKTPLDFCHNCQKNENSLGSKYLLPREKMLYFCHDVDIREVDFYSRS